MRWNALAAALAGVGIIATAQAAEMLVCGFSSNKVYRYNMSGGLIGTLDAAGNLSGPLCARMGPDGKIYVASEGNNRIVRFSASTGAYLDDFINDAGLDSPTGITWDGAGNAYVASFNGSKVRKYNSSGGFVSDFVTAGSGGLSGADNGISFGPDGNLYVPSYNNNRVLKYNGTTGALISTFIGSIGRPRTFEWFTGRSTSPPKPATRCRNATRSTVSTRAISSRPVPAACRRRSGWPSAATDSCTSPRATTRS